MGQPALLCLIGGFFIGETVDGKFEPDSDATRAMFITALYRSAGSPTVNHPNDIAFDDVPLGQWFSIPIRWAKNIGIIEGYDDHTFSPHKGIPREQMALLMYRYAQVLNYDISTNNANPSEFPDFNNTPNGCRTAMLLAIKYDGWKFNRFFYTSYMCANGCFESLRRRKT